jgi:hypothetical protein
MIMKNSSTLVLVIFLVICYGCSPKLTKNSAEVNYISSVDGTITLRVIGDGSNQKAQESSEVMALNVLLFRGIPESQEKLALVGSNEIEEKEKNKDYFNRLLVGKRYKSFIMSVIPTTGTYKESGLRRSAFDIKVNTSALRRDLEQNNIIRKFGY